MIQYFTKHPKSVNMTYMQHCVFSLSLAWNMALCSIKACIHAFNPNWFIHSSTELCYYLHTTLKMRNNENMFKL
jgi:hypothetical protein